MADNPGIAAIQAVAAKKKNAAGTVANALSNSPQPPNNKGANPKAAAIARRLSKGSSKSGPTKKSDNDGDEQESGY